MRNRHWQDIESAAALRTCSLFSQYSKLLQANEPRSNLFTRGLSQVDGVEAELSKGNDKVLCVCTEKNPIFPHPGPLLATYPHSVIFQFAVIFPVCLLLFCLFETCDACTHKCQPNKISLWFLLCCSFTRFSSVKKYMARSETEQTKLTQSVQ